MGIKALVMGYGLGTLIGFWIGAVAGWPAGVLTAWLGGGALGLGWAVVAYRLDLRQSALREAEFAKWDDDLDTDRMAAEWRQWDADLEAEQAAHVGASKQAAS